MNKNVYESILNTIWHFKGLSKDCLSLLQTKYSEFSDDTLQSIISIEYQKRMKNNYSKSPASQHKFYNLFIEAIARGDEPGVILRLSEKYDITPCLLAKLILQKHYRDLDNDEVVTNNNIKKYLRDTTLIQNMDLAYEVYLATLYDDKYSPIADTMKSSLGQQYEIQLYKQITELGLTFRDEQDLRKYGYDKTPDVKLEIPIAVDGVVVHWIESKALFADEDIHKEYVKNQYSSYWNRFGPGLVIYWFGFVEMILDSSDKRFIIKNHCPTNIVQIAK